jgi:hypothetical protein
MRGIQQYGDASGGMWSKPTVRRKTKIVCTIGPSTNTKEMIWKLAEAGMNVARMNMSHGDHASHKKVIDLVKEYNAQSKDNVIAIMLDTKVSPFMFFTIRFICWYDDVSVIMVLFLWQLIVHFSMFFRVLRLGVGICHNQSI